MIWLTWRQLRSQALTAVFVTTAIVVVAAVTGPNLADAVTGSSSPYDLLTSTDRTLFSAGIVVLAVLPASSVRFGAAQWLPGSWKRAHISWRGPSRQPADAGWRPSWG